MQIKLKWVELHTPMFLGGINYGLKLDCSKRQNLQMLYNRDKQEVIIFVAGNLAILPMSTVAIMVPFDISDVLCLLDPDQVQEMVNETALPMKPSISLEAQKHQISPSLPRVEISPSLPMPDKSNSMDGAKTNKKPQFEGVGK